MSYNQTFKSNSFALAPATPTLLVAANPNRRTLLLSVNGTAPATFKFNSAPVSATDGMTLGAASVSGEQGGSILFTADSVTTESFCPINSVYAYSTLGTTVNIFEGTVYAFL